jgi:hypothetical protein
LDNRRAIIERSTGGRLPASWVEWKVAYSASHSSGEAFAAYFRAWADRLFWTSVADSQYSQSQGGLLCCYPNTFHVFPGGIHYEHVDTA